MEKPSGDFWWLVALEALLFFSLPFWELTAPWAEPATYPFRFAGTVLASATVAMLVCHIGPAFFAARFGHRKQTLAPLFWSWLAAGYVALLVGWSMALTTVLQVLLERPKPGATVLLRPLTVGPVFLASVIIAGSVRSWWKPATASLLLFGAGNLLWALATRLNGLWVLNQHFSGNPEQFEWAIAKGIFLCAAPALVIGWRIGLTAPEGRRIWQSGIVGMWIPLVFSVTVASLATQAGSNLHWVPSLPRGFNWALTGVKGELWPVPFILTTLTVFGPALFCIATLRPVCPPWAHWKKLWLVPVALWLLLALPPSPYFPGEVRSYSDLHSLSAVWSGVLILLGAAAGAAVIVCHLTNYRPPEDGQPGNRD